MFQFLSKNLLFILFFAIVILPIIIYFSQIAFNRVKISLKEFPTEWRNILQEKVDFHGLIPKVED